ncbi:MAG: hypothetical protein ACRC2N_09325 [Aeromonas sp.]
MLRNQNVTKKQHYKTAEELLPYLQEYPEHLEHPTIKKVQGAIKTFVQHPKQLAEIMKKVLEEIEIEEGKEDPDQYLIHRLSELYLNNKAAN